jgi:hypothetical protein
LEAELVLELVCGRPYKVGTAPAEAHAAPFDDA